MRIFVGNLPYSTTDDDLNALFSDYGKVTEAKVIKDRETGQSKGFGFVSMDSDNEGQAAIEALNDGQYGGRSLRVDKANPRETGGGGGSRPSYDGGNRGRGGRDDRRGGKGGRRERHERY